MESSLTITLDQLDLINRSLNKAMAVVSVLAHCGSGEQSVSEAPESEDVFLTMQIVLEELEKIWGITQKLGR